MNGSLEEMIASLESGAQVNRVVDEYGSTALHLAAKDRKFGEAKVRQLVRRGATIDARDEYDRTPLHDAAIGMEHGKCFRCQLVTFTLRWFCWCDGGAVGCRGESHRCEQVRSERSPLRGVVQL